MVKKLILISLLSVIFYGCDSYTENRKEYYDGFKHGVQLMSSIYHDGLTPKEAYAKYDKYGVLLELELLEEEDAD